MKKTGANASVIFVPPPFAADAVMEAADAGIALVVCITEGIPTLDMMRAMTFLKEQADDAADRARTARASSRRARRKAGIIPGHICSEGRIGIVSKSGTLTYEAIHQLTRLGLGQTTCIGIGGDPLIGTTHIDALKLFAGRSRNRRGDHDRRDRRHAPRKKPPRGSRRTSRSRSSAFIAGQTAPPGRRMGHAGAIIAGGKGTAAEKMAALTAAGVTVVKSPADMGKRCQRACSERFAASVR